MNTEANTDFKVTGEEWNFSKDQLNVIHCEAQDAHNDSKTHRFQIIRKDNKGMEIRYNQAIDGNLFYDWSVVTMLHRHEYARIYLAPHLAQLQLKMILH